MEDAPCPCQDKLTAPCYRWDDEALHVCACYDAANALVPG